jgi:hypothetical protein
MKEKKCYCGALFRTEEEIKSHISEKHPIERMDKCCD